LQLLGAIKDGFKDKFWVLFAPKVMVDIIFARSNQNYPSVSPVSQDGFWIMELRRSDSLP
jgi:hypothetical protein